MAFDLVTFLRALAKHLRGGTADPGTPRTLWLYAAIEGVVDGTSNAASAYTVLAPYPGQSLPANAPLQPLSLQLMTTGPAGDAEAAVTQAQGLYNKLLDGQGRPLRGQAIDGFVVQAVLNLRGPGVVGRDEKQRLLIATNFDVQAYATA
jgi:hypothetical protein